MKKITQFMYSAHRILGTIMCLVFMTWFLSAFIMMYHHFPHVSNNEIIRKNKKLSSSSEQSPSITSIIKRLPPNAEIKGITLDCRLKQTVFHIKTNKGQFDFPSDSLKELSKINKEFISNTAQLWCNAPIERIDTLNELDQWTPYIRLKKEIPIYKIYFLDKEKTQLYIGSKSGEVLQFSNQKERFWSWIGAIPHWAYFSWLRQNPDLWFKTIIFLTGLGCLMLVAGFWVAIDVWRKTHTHLIHKFSPYRKKWYHWHYVSGIFFGFFVLTFTFSGMMSMIDHPAWIRKSIFMIEPQVSLRLKMPKIENYVLDYWKLIKAYPNIRQIEWNNFYGHPYYTITDGKKEQYIDAKDSIPRPLFLSKTEILHSLESLYKNNVPGTKIPQIKLTPITHYETYYRDMSNMMKERRQLPVWKAVVEDPNNSIFYIHPETGDIRYVDTASRWKYWSFTALHRMRFPGLCSNITLRKALLWILLLGGSVVSLSGVVLGIKYIKRKIRL